MGYLDSDGSIPEMPVELYDFLLDLGSLPQRQLPPEDLRSTRNENSGLPGARRYLGQAAAFRLAYDADPALLESFIEERNGILAIRQTPEDMRKPCLAHLMEQAAAGNGAAQSVFRQIGRNVGQISREMRFLMRPRTDVRYLFGRFVKHPACFRLLQEGWPGDRTRSPAGGGGRGAHLHDADAPAALPRRDGGAIRSGHRRHVLRGDIA